MSSDAWIDAENDLIVADHFAMLADDVAGRPYNKAEHRRLQACRTREQMLGQRSEKNECPQSLRFFDAGQCVRFVLGGLARVDKSDKVEAAGRWPCAMGKA